MSPAPVLTFSPASIPVLLNYPVTRHAGTIAETISTLHLHRPQTRHVKELALLIGREVLAGLGQAGGENRNEELFALMAKGVLEAEKLDGLTALVADLCGVEKGVIDNLDFSDLQAVGEAFLSLFKTSQSDAPSSSVQI